MNDELRAAANRLRQVRVNEANREVCWLSKVYDPLWTGEDHRTADYHHDMRIVSDAYLVEHPADDDEPVTEEWMQKHIRLVPGHGFKITDRVSIFNTRNGWQLYVGFYGGDDTEDSFSIARLKSRGDVRRLCTALGITLEEPDDG